MMKQLCTTVMFAALGCAPALFAQSVHPAAMPAVAAQTSTSNSIAPSKVFGDQIGGVEKEITSLVDAMPTGKFDFAPTQGEFKGVRTFGEQARHVAQANTAYAAAIQGKKPDEAAMKAFKDMKGKDAISAALKKSFTDLHAAVATITTENAFTAIPSPYGQGQATRAGIAAGAVAHTFDHYGQMVEYARMNGIVPPASRK
jgi:uncharacterized damage-inducible protein DinB